MISIYLKYIEINNLTLYYDEIIHWGYDEEFFIIYYKDGQERIINLKLDKNQFELVDYAIKRNIGLLINSGEFQGIEV